MEKLSFMGNVGCNSFNCPKTTKITGNPILSPKQGEEGCDGGIAGKKIDILPDINRCEERQIIIDPKTGEKVYVEDWLKQLAQNNGAVFSTTA